MTKRELVAVIAEGAKITKKQGHDALDIALGAIIKSVTKNEPVTLIGFGTFKQSKRTARKGRNPKTGKVIDIPATQFPKFVPGKGFKEAVK
jgi:DNA-binding protein HU-beta